ncbi:MAG: hypothetical protein H0X01_03425 [Nitrospira sp.]|nr:hypothetical protein [Nitrospira sp.]
MALHFQPPHERAHPASPSRDPLHGNTLETIITELLDYLALPGWASHPRALQQAKHIP